MKKFKLIVFSLFVMFFVTVVNAESIKINKISESNLDYSFDILISDVTHENNINVVEGVIYYNSDYIKNVELVTSNNWEFKYKIDNDKLIFITYVASDFAKTNDSLFNVKLSLNDNVDKNEVELLINDLVTNNGDSLFSFKKMKYKLQDLSNSTISDPSTINKGTIENKIDKEIIADDFEDDNMKQDCECDEIPVPQEEKAKEIFSVSESENKVNWLFAFILCFSIILNIVQFIKMNKICVIGNVSSSTIKEDENKVKKHRRGRRKSNKSNMDGGLR